jgi:hypothetical protein
MDKAGRVCTLVREIRGAGEAMRGEVISDLRRRHSVHLWSQCPAGVGRRQAFAAFAALLCLFAVCCWLLVDRVDRRKKAAGIALALALSIFKTRRGRQERPPSGHIPVKLAS